MAAKFRRGPKLPADLRDELASKNDDTLTVTRKRKFGANNVSRKEQRKEERKAKKMKKGGNSNSSSTGIDAKNTQNGTRTNGRKGSQGSKKSTVKFADTVKVKEFGNSSDDNEFDESDDFEGFGDDSDDDEANDDNNNESADDTWAALKRLKEAKNNSSKPEKKSDSKKSKKEKVVDKEEEDTWAALKKLKEAKQAKNSKDAKSSKDTKASKDSSSTLRIVKESDIDTLGSDDELDSDDFDDLGDSDDDFGDFDDMDDDDMDDDGEDENVDDTWAALKKLKESKSKAKAKSSSSDAVKDTMEQLRLAKLNKKKLEAATEESDTKQSKKEKKAKNDKKSEKKPEKKQGRSLADLLNSKPSQSSSSSSSSTSKTNIPLARIPKNATPEQIEQFKRDDEDIDYYARKLGLKDAYSDLGKEEDDDLDDGLEDLLDGLNFDYGDYIEGEEDEEDEDEEDSDVPKLDGLEESDSEFEGFGQDSDLEDIERLDTEEEEEEEEEGHDDNDFDSDLDSDSDQPKRENPYVAPAAPSQKYIPPSLRNKAQETGLARSNLPQTQELERLRRQIKGQINRLADTNIAGIVKTLSDMYMHHPRQYMNEIITTTIIESIALQGALSEKFLAVHAALVAALYRTAGLEFGAYFVQTLVEEFDKRFKNVSDPSVAGNSSNDTALVSNKEAANLISLVAELYSFNIVWCGIVYDFVRQLLTVQDAAVLDENKTEILLKVLRSAGSQLRSDDPRALRDIVVKLHELKASAWQNGTPFSARTMFMVGFIEDLKNNKQKKNGEVTELARETRKRMRDFINANVKAPKRDPLRVSLEDIRNVDTRGKWWLVGSAWRSQNNVGVDENDDENTAQDSQKNNEFVDHHALKDILDSATPDWMELARQQRMNTDIRRAIFVAIMSSGDYVDAVDRLEKLKLRSKQEREIVKVLLHCCSMEPIYNPFYSLVAARLCSNQRALAKTFAFSLYDFLGEVEGEDSDDEREGVGRLMDGADEDDGEINGSDLEEGTGAAKIIAMKQARKRAAKAARQEERDSHLSPEEQTKKLCKIVHMAKLYGTLVALGVVPLTILKTANMVAPAPDTTVFLDLFFTTMFLKVAANGGVGIAGAQSAKKKTSKMGVSFANAMFERKLDPESERGLVNLVAQTAGIGKKRKNSKKSRNSQYAAGFDSDGEDDGAPASMDYDNESGIALLRKMARYLPKLLDSAIVQEELEASVGGMKKKSKKSQEKKAEKLNETKATIKWSVSLLTDAIQDILEREDKIRNSRF